MSKTIQNAILDNSKLKPREAIIDKENIVIPELPERKQPARSIIKNVQHHHCQELDRNKFTNIVLINKISKPFLNKTIKVKQKRFCEWALNLINNHNNIFICNDESWHEVRKPFHKKYLYQCQRNKEFMSMIFIRNPQSLVLCSRKQ